MGVTGSLMVGGHFGGPVFRHAIERMKPAEYLEGSYYEHWLHAFEDVLAVRGIVTREEMDARVARLAKGG